MSLFWHHPNDTNLLLTGPIYRYLHKKQWIMAYLIMRKHVMVLKTFLKIYFQISLFQKSEFWYIKKTSPYNCFGWIHKTTHFLYLTVGHASVVFSLYWILLFNLEPAIWHCLLQREETAPCMRMSSFIPSTNHRSTTLTRSQHFNTIN